jgi:two-component system, LytTR family, response regulator
MPERALTVLVVDDELLARQRLEDLLGRVERVGTVLTAESGKAAVASIREHEPDLVFLDMQMPGMTGLDVVRVVGPAEMPVTIFVTAHDHYAVQAFEVAALDYLLKPFGDDRFEQAFDRAVRQLRLARVGDAASRLVGLLDGHPAAGAGAVTGESVVTRAAPGRIAVESGGTLHVVAVEDITHVTAAGPYAELHTAARTYLIRETMQSLEQRLEPDGFFRVHRSSLVRLDRVSAVERASGGDYSVRLSGGEELSVSRARVRELERRLGVER